MLLCRHFGIPPKHNGQLVSKLATFLKIFAVVHFFFGFAMHVSVDVLVQSGPYEETLWTSAGLASATLWQTLKVLVVRLLILIALLIVIQAAIKLAKRLCANRQEQILRRGGDRESDAM